MPSPLSSTSGSSAKVFIWVKSTIRWRATSVLIKATLQRLFAAPPEQIQGNGDGQDRASVHAQIDHRLLKAIGAQPIAGDAHLCSDGQDAARGADRGDEQK